MPQVEDEGTEVTLENTIEAQFTKSDVEGNSTQETTEGYNIAEIIREPITLNGVTFTPLEDGGLKIQGTLTQGGNYRILTSVNLPVVQAGKTYTRVAKVVGTLNKNNKYVLISGRNNSSQDIMGDMSIAQDTTTYKTSSITNDETMSNIMIYCSGSGVVFNCVLYFMLVEGEYSASNPIDFEKYTNGASPNLSYEQPIKSAGDDINEFDKDNANVINGYIGTANKIVPYASNQLIYFSVTPLKTYTIKKYIGNANIWIATSENKPQITSVVNNLVKPEKKEYTIAMPENQNYLIIQVRLDVDVTEGYTLKDILNGIKIVEGTYIGKYTPYSPYGMGSINEKIGNANILDTSEVKTVKNQAGDNRTGYYCKIPQTGRYLLLLNTTNTMYFGKSSDINVSTTLIGSTNSSFSTNYDFNAGEYFVIWGTKTDTDKLMVKLADGQTDYIPHKEQDYSIFVQQPFRSIGDVRDLFFKNTVDSPYYDENLILNGWYERHYIARKIFDGTENLTKRNDGDGSTSISFNYNISNLGSTSQMNNKFQPSGASTDGKEGLAIAGQLIQLFVQIKRNRLASADVTGFKGWLSEQYTNGNPLYVDYILATPLDLPCTETQIQQIENKPSTYKDFTIIQSEDETPAYLEVSGIYDLKKLINN